jgi:hypothetical protein
LPSEINPVTDIVLIAASEKQHGALLSISAACITTSLLVLVRGFCQIDSSKLESPVRVEDCPLSLLLLPQNPCPQFSRSQT